MSLNSPAITELDVERATCLLIDEWLAKWFDGQAHSVGASPPALFPAVARAFGQSPAAQPLDGAEIRLVILPRSERAQSNDDYSGSGKLCVDSVFLNFFVHAKVQGLGQSEYLAGRVADLLKAILTNPDSRYELAERGIHHLNPLPPRLISSNDYAARLVGCAAQLHYSIVL